MSDIDITEVRVTFGNGVKKEEYGALKKAEVTIVGVVREGCSGEQALAQAGFIAQSKVAELLGTAAPVAPAGLGATAGGVAGAGDTAPAAPRRRGPAKAQPAAETPPADEAAPASEPAKDTDFDVVTEQPAPDNAAAENAAEAPAEDEWGAEAVAEVTDKDLTDACTKHAARLAEAGDAAGSVKIRTLIGTFNPDPTAKFSLVQIPAAQRADFLTKVAALQPNA